MFTMSFYYRERIAKKGCHNKASELRSHNNQHEKAPLTHSKEIRWFRGKYERFEVHNYMATGEWRTNNRPREKGKNISKQTLRNRQLFLRARRQKSVGLAAFDARSSFSFESLEWHFHDLTRRCYQQSGWQIVTQSRREPLRSFPHTTSCFMAIYIVMHHVTQSLS